MQNKWECVDLYLAVQSTVDEIDVLVQGRRNSIANALDILAISLSWVPFTNMG